MRLLRSTAARATLLGASFALVAPLPGTLTAVQPALARAAPESFAELAAKLLPAVVNVSSTQTMTAKTGPGAGPEIPMFPPGSPFEQFFKDFLNRNRQGQGAVAVAVVVVEATTSPGRSGERKVWVLASSSTRQVSS